MSDCVAVTSSFSQEAFLVFDSCADQFGNPLLTGQFTLSGESWASQVAPLLAATFSVFPSIAEFQMNYARAVTNALVIANEGPSPACVFVSLSPVALPSGNNNFGIPISPGQSVLMTKPPAYQSTPSTTPILTPLFVVGAALQNQAVISLRFGNVSVSYRFPANGAV